MKTGLYETLERIAATIESRKGGDPKTSYVAKLLAEGVTTGGADAVLAASVFHFGDLTVRQVKEHMKAKGIEVRL